MEKFAYSFFRSLALNRSSHTHARTLLNCRIFHVSKIHICHPSLFAFLLFYNRHKIYRLNEISNLLELDSACSLIFYTFSVCLFLRRAKKMQTFSPQQTQISEIEIDFFCSIKYQFQLIQFCMQCLA